MVGIITRRDGYNFGSSLQAYAIQAALDNLSIDNIIINYCELSPKAKLRLSFLNFRDWILRFIPKYKDKYLQRKKFDAFEQNMRIDKHKRMHNIPEDYLGCDTYLCGSDQIWNPSQAQTSFFLDFVCNGHRVAYAPSFGNLNTNNRLNKASIQEIKKFDFLSCRELSGINYLQEDLKKSATLVVDPTLLLSCKQWHKVSSSINIDGPYILTYFLGKNNFPQLFIEKLAKKRNLKVFNLQMFYNSGMSGAVNIFASPDEFIYLIEHATCICTNSYHGTLFSILFKKEFYLFNRNYSINNYTENSRFDTLKLIFGQDLKTYPISQKDVTIFSFDYCKAYDNLNKYRHKSIQYLSNACK